MTLELLGCAGLQGLDGMAGESPALGRAQSLGGEQRGMTMRRVASVPLTPPDQETERLVGDTPVWNQLVQAHECNYPQSPFISQPLARVTRPFHTCLQLW